MPNFSIVDSHVHLFDPQRFNYPWMVRAPKIAKLKTPKEYLEAHSGISVEKLVFAEVWTARHQNVGEAQWVQDMASQFPVIAGITAQVPLEDWDQSESDLDRLQRLPLFRSIRRITEVEPDPEFCLGETFVRSVRALADRQLPCELCIFPHLLPTHAKLIEKCPDTQFVLNHLGKPQIKSGDLTQWRKDFAELAKLPNVVAKLSGIVTEANPDWTKDQILPVVDHAIECFGFDRLMYGSDWPVIDVVNCTPQMWIEIVDEATKGVAPADLEKLYRDNALRVYRL